MAGEVHFAARLQALAQTYPDRPAIVDATGTWSFRQFNARLTRLGNALHGLDLEKGDRVALLLPDIREYLEVVDSSHDGSRMRALMPMRSRLAGVELIGAVCDMPEPVHW